MSHYLNLPVAAYSSGRNPGSRRSRSRAAGPSTLETTSLATSGLRELADTVGRYSTAGNGPGKELNRHEAIRVRGNESSAGGVAPERIRKNKPRDGRNRRGVIMRLAHIVLKLCERRHSGSSAGKLKLRIVSGYIQVIPMKARR